jgi:RNA polymerase sigma-70 factor (ECF subfamily)
MRLSRKQLADDLGRAGQGDVAAFVRVYHATSAKLFGVVVRILGRGEVAEEILQEIYLRVWQRADGFDRDQSSPITWLVAIARNRALDERRRRQLVSLDEVPGLFEMASDEDIEAENLAAEEHRRLKACIEALEPDQKRSLELIYAHGLTRDEAAQRMGQKVTTVRTWIRQGLAALKKCLTDE